MDEPDRLSPAVLAEQIRNLDRLHRAHELELHDMRVELDARLRQSYLTTAEMRNVFVTRDEMQRQATVRREWPLIIFAAVVATCNVVTLIVVLRGGR